MNSLAPLKIGFVGLSFGQHVADALLAGPGSKFFRLAAGCDVETDKIQRFCSQHSLPGYASLDALLEDPAIPVIALFSGPAGRAGLLRKIIRAGKDVMTTKPFELDPREARLVLEEAKSLGRIIHLNSPPAEFPAYLKQILDWQNQYQLGRPISCRGEMLCSYHEEADGRWLDDPALCPAAPLFRLGIYTINDLGRLFGGIHSVQVISSRIRTGRPTSDNAQLSLLFANGAIGSVFASFCVDNGQAYANSLTLNYERGTIYRNVFPVAYGQAEGSSRLDLVACPEPGEVTHQAWTSPEISGSYPWESFARAIQTRDTASMPIADIVAAIETVSAMARSENSGRTEEVRSAP